MNHRHMLTLFLFGVSSLAVAASEKSVNVCELLQAENLAPWGYGPQLKSESFSLTYKQVEANAPSDVQADTCTVHGESAEHRGVTFVVVESFSNDTRAEAISAWVKGTAAMEKNPDEKVEEILVGDTTCEAGEYSNQARGGSTASQHYVACDRVVGTRHLLVNIQQPDATKLPTPTQVKELLDQAAIRLGAR